MVKTMWIVRSSLILLLSISVLDLESKTPSDVIEMTQANMRGQKELYQKGWLIIPSSKKSLQYCYKKSVLTSAQAMRQFFESIEDDSQEFATWMKTNPKEAKAMLLKYHRQGSEIRSKTFRKTQQLVKDEYYLGKKSLSKAWQQILKGTLHLPQRTTDDLKELKGIYGNYFSDIKNDILTTKTFVRKLKGERGKEIEIFWGKSFKRASKEFNGEYEKSAKKKNSLLALPNIFWGHLKAIYYAVVKPAGKTLYKGGKKSARIAVKSVEYLIGGPIIVAGRTLYSLGGSVYYTGKMGVKLIAPTVEAGLLSAIGLIAISSTIPTYMVGGSLGVTNQVALSTFAPAAAGTKLALVTAKDSAKYLGNVVYDLGKGVGEVVVANTLSGMVLGYNAISALPMQLTLGAVNSVFFLAWDGPKLVIAYAKGEIDGKNIDSLPVGSVIDLQKLKASGVEVKILTEDDETIKKVIKRSPPDLKVIKRD